MPDATPNAGPQADILPGLAERLAGSIRRDERISRLDRPPPPDPGEVRAILDDLLDLVFPGFFGFELRPGHDLRDALHQRLGDLRVRLSRQVCAALSCERSDWADATVDNFLERLPFLRQMASLDVEAAMAGDPACTSYDEAVLCMPGVHAVTVHRLAHELVRLGVPLLPRMMSETAHSRTGIDIHPGARIGRSFFIDHGTGVVIGETARIGDHCKVYQGVTLGARSLRKDEQGRVRRVPKRHPTLEDHVTVYASATILGGDTVIGTGSIVAGGVFLTESVPPGHIVHGPRVQMELRPNPERPQMAYDI